MIDPIRVTLLLCDAAQEVGGKLYVLGGGWSVHRGTPVTMALAVRMEVPWDEANAPHACAARLVTEDGRDPVLPTPEGALAPTPIGSEWQMEVGRPPGVRPGTLLGVPLVVSVPPLPLAPGGYEWHVTVDGAVRGHVGFTVTD